MNHQQQHGLNKIQKIPIDEINEEPTQYDGLNFDLIFCLNYLFMLFKLHFLSFKLNR